MKNLLIAGCFLLLTASTCKNKKSVAPDSCYKGRLEVKGNCMNYTVSVVSGNMAALSLASRWTDENTGKSYTNVFALESKCNFPATINEGDEFYFTVDSTTVQNCAVCMAFYPVPPQKISIRVLDAPCTP